MDKDETTPKKGKSKLAKKRQAKKPRASQKKSAPVGKFLLVLIIFGLIALRHPIIDFIKEQQAQLADSKKFVPTATKEVKKVKVKKRLQKTPEIKVVEEEYIEPVKVQDNVFSGELKHYSFNQVLKDKCFECHGAEGKEIEGDFDLVKLVKSGSTNRRKWEGVYKSIKKGEMPPEDDAEALNADEKDLLLSSIKMMQEELVESESVRVLTPHEIENTLTDLFDIERSEYNPFTALYQPYSAAGYFTHQRNVLSPHYISQYYRMLYDILQSFVGLRPQTENVAWNIEYRGRFSGGYSRAKRTRVYFADNGLCHFKAVDASPKKFDRQARKSDGNNNSLVNNLMNQRVIPPGTYKFRFKAHLENMDMYKLTEKKYGAKLVNLYKNYFKNREGSYGMKMSFYLTPPGDVDTFATATKKITTLEVVEPGEYEFEFTVNRKTGFAYKLEEGLPHGNTMARYIAEHVYGKDFDVKQIEEIYAKYTNIEVTDFPTLVMENPTLEGPYNVKLHDLSFEKGAVVRTTEVGEKFRTLHKLLGMKHNIIYSYIFKDFQVDKMKYEDAYRNAMIMFFLSPQFLAVDNDIKNKDTFQRFASYALLKSSPNQEFYDVYKKAKSARKPTLLSDYLLKNEKFSRFVKPFTYQWLKLGEINNNLPDEQDFQRYYAENYPESYRIEAELFMENMFRENLPVHDLVLADYSFWNESLRDFYHQPDARRRSRTSAKTVSAADFVKEPVGDTNRGGLLGMGAFLTATGNGVDPLPIRRAAWILENLLDNPLKTPDNIDTTEFETGKEAKSFKDRLAQHSTNTACKSCHKRIDPIAILMNEYDTVGGDNLEYRQEDVRINNQKLGSISELKIYLSFYNTAMARGFTKNLISYMLGRETGLRDETKIDAILAETQSRAYRVGDIYSAIVKHYFF